MPRDFLELGKAFKCSNKRFMGRHEIRIHGATEAKNYDPKRLSHIRFFPCESNATPMEPRGTHVHMTPNCSRLRRDVHLKTWRRTGPGMSANEIRLKPIEVISK